MAYPTAGLEQPRGWKRLYAKIARDCQPFRLTLALRSRWRKRTGLPKLGEGIKRTTEGPTKLQHFLLSSCVIRGSSASGKYAPAVCRHSRVNATGEVHGCWIFGSAVSGFWAQVWPFARGFWRFVLGKQRGFVDGAVVFVPHVTSWGAANARSRSLPTDGFKSTAVAKGRLSVRHGLLPSPGPWNALSYGVRSSSTHYKKSGFLSQFLTPTTPTLRPNQRPRTTRSPLPQHLRPTLRQDTEFRPNESDPQLPCITYFVGTKS